MRLGLHRYFDAFKWKNTTLDNFVDTFAQVWTEQGDDSMGSDFNFKAWFMQWLTTSGCNSLTPIVERDESGAVSKVFIE